MIAAGAAGRGPWWWRRTRARDESERGRRGRESKRLRHRCFCGQVLLDDGTKGLQVWCARGLVLNWMESRLRRQWAARSFVPARCAWSSWSSCAWLRGGCARTPMRNSRRCVEHAPLFRFGALALLRFCAFAGFVCFTEQASESRKRDIDCISCIARNETTRTSNKAHGIYRMGA